MPSLGLPTTPAVRLDLSVGSRTCQFRAKRGEGKPQQAGVSHCKLVESDLNKRTIILCHLPQTCLLICSLLIPFPLPSCVHTPHGGEWDVHTPALSCPLQVPCVQKCPLALSLQAHSWVQVLYQEFVLEMSAENWSGLCCKSCTASRAAVELQSP